MLHIPSLCTKYFILAINSLLQISQGVTTQTECASILRTLVHQIYLMNAKVITTVHWLQTNVAVVKVST